MNTNTNTAYANVNANVNMNVRVSGVRVWIQCTFSTAFVKLAKQQQKCETFHIHIDTHTNSHTFIRGQLIN